MEGVYTLATKTQPSDSLQERLELESAQGWKPESGDTLIGTILDIKASAPNEYGIYPIVTVATENGNVAVHCFHSILKDGLLESRPAVGERLAIAYLGEVVSKKRKDSNGNPINYHNYSVVVDRPQTDTGASWDLFSPNSDTDSD